MPVYDQKGCLLGEVCDICIADNGNVTSLIIKRKGFFQKLYSLSLDQVITFGSRAIVIQDSEYLTKYKEAQNEYTMCHYQPIAQNYTISGRGEELGLLEDVYFQEEMGKIIGYELTDGFFSDMSEGKRVIQSVYPPKFGKDAIIVTVNQCQGGDRPNEVPELSK